MRKIVTLTDDEVVEAYSRIKTIRGVSEESGMTSLTIRKILCEHGIKYGNEVAKRVSDEELLKLYRQKNSVWKVAEEVGMCGQAVFERLKKLNAVRPVNEISQDDVEKIRKFYEDGFVRGDGKLDLFAQSIRRTKQFVCRKARQLGLTNNNRRLSEDLTSLIGGKISKFWSEHEHCKGMLGKCHTPETKMHLHNIGVSRWKALSDNDKKAETLSRMKGRLEKCGSLVPNVKRCNWKSGYRTIAGRKLFFRSRWEANYCRFLEYRKSNGEISEWEHEPYTIIFKG